CVVAPSQVQPSAESHVQPAMAAVGSINAAAATRIRNRKRILLWRRIPAQFRRWSGSRASLVRGATRHPRRVSVGKTLPLPAAADDGGGDEAGEDRQTEQLWVEPHR